MKPLEIAQRLAAHLPASNLVGKVEAVPPGYINFALADAWLAGQVETILAQGEPGAAWTQGTARVCKSNSSAPTRLAH